MVISRIFIHVAHIWFIRAITLHHQNINLFEMKALFSYFMLTHVHIYAFGSICCKINNIKNTSHIYNKA